MTLVTCTRVAVHRATVGEASPNRKPLPRVQNLLVMCMFYSHGRAASLAPGGA